MKKHASICKIEYNEFINSESGECTMEITDIRVRKVNSDSKMKAIISITLDDEIAIHDIKIIDGNEGPFIAMPSRRMQNGEFRDIAHPINGEMRKRLEEAIFAKYNEFIDKMRLGEVEESNL